MLYLAAKTIGQASIFAAVSSLTAGWMLQSAVGNQCFSLGRRDQYNVQYRTANNNEDTAKQSILIEKVWMSKSAKGWTEWMKFQSYCTQLGITLTWDLITSTMHAPFFTK